MVAAAQMAAAIAEVRPDLAAARRRVDAALGRIDLVSRAAVGACAGEYLRDAADQLKTAANMLLQVSREIPGPEAR